MDMDVICVGNATIDAFVLLKDQKNFNYDKFANSLNFPLGEKIPLDEHILTLGGNACNVSIGLSRLGLKSSLISEIGNDEFSEKIVNGLKNEKVDISHLKRDGKKKPYFNIVLAYGGDRTILSERNPVDLPIKVGKVNTKFFYLTSFNGDWHEAYQDILQNNQESLIAFNPGSRQLNEDIEEVKKLFSRVEILFVNMIEAQKLTNDSNPDVKVIIQKLKSLGVKTAVITDGINGSYAIDKDEKVYQIGVLSKEKPTERTGAGDSYAAGFLFGLIQGKNVPECMKYGAVNSDSVIKKVGAQAGLLTKDEIENNVNQQPDFNAVEI